MGKILRLWLKKFFYRCGYFPPSKMRTLDVTLILIENSEPVVKGDELKIFTEYFLTLKSNKKYDEFLKTLCPSLNLNYDSAHFLEMLPNEGVGLSSLGVFRKLNVSNEYFFEKIYLSLHPALKKVEFFHHSVTPYLKQDINSPKIRHIFKGNYITVVYYDFFDLKKINDTALLTDEIINTTLMLYNLSTKNNRILNIPVIPKDLKDFNTHFEYRKQRPFAKKLLEKNEISIVDWEEKIKITKRILTHGDIYKTNIYCNNTLVDWDTFGYFPLGFDPAFSFERLLVEGKINENIDEWLENYEGKILKEDWEAFCNNFSFFTFVFLAHSFHKNNYPSLKNSLINMLQS